MGSWKPRGLLWRASALTILAAAVVMGQAAIYLCTSPVTLENDSNDYLRIAGRILNAQAPFDVARTPGYPFFLAVVQRVWGAGNLAAVVKAQTALTVLAVVELAGLAGWLLGSRWAACLVASLLALNIDSLGWERSVLSEGVALWMTISLACLTAWCLEGGNPAKELRSWWLLGATMAALTMWRPASVYIAPISALLLLDRKTLAAGRRAVANRVLAVMLPTLLSLLIVISANIKIYHFAGVTDITSVNVFGKAVECGLMQAPTQARPGGASRQPDCCLAPEREARFHELRSKASAFYASESRTDPWLFLVAYPEYQRDHFGLLGEYARFTLLSHPQHVLATMLVDLFGTMRIDSHPEAVFDVAPPEWVRSLHSLSILESKLGALAPLAVLVWAWMTWRKPDSARRRLGLLLSVWALGSDAMSATLGYGVAYRIRFPFDWVLLLLSAQALLGLIRRLPRVRS